VPAGSELSLDHRVIEILSGRPGHVAFGGLRRVLGAHPESLTRSLRRLERFGTVGHDADGYFLVESPSPLPTNAGLPRWEQLAKVRLPSTIGPEVVVGLLAGRWFGQFRWVGLQEGRHGPALAWSAPGLPGFLLVRWSAGALRVVAELPKGRELSGELARAGDELLWHVLSRLRSAAPAPASTAPVALPGSVRALAQRSGPTTSNWAS
jgi:hypothetical protein